MRTTQPIVKETDMVTKYSILPGLDKKYKKLPDCSGFSLCFAKIGYFPGFPRVLQKLAIFQVFLVFCKNWLFSRFSLCFAKIGCIPGFPGSVLALYKGLYKRSQYFTKHR